MNRADLFAAIKPFAPGARFNDAHVRAIDALADLFGLAKSMQPGMQASEAALALIRKSEALRLTAYQDSGGVWTIGYGHTGPEVHNGLVITEVHANELLAEDVEDAERDVRLYCPITTQHQFDALVSFTFNLGGGQLKTSTLRRLHNEGDYAGARAQFARWVHDDGVRLHGLEVRRAAEAALYGS